MNESSHTCIAAGQRCRSGRRRKLPHAPHPAPRQSQQRFGQTPGRRWQVCCGVVCVCVSVCCSMCCSVVCVCVAVWYVYVLQCFLLCCSMCCSVVYVCVPVCCSVAPGSVTTAVTLMSYASTMPPPAGRLQWVLQHVLQCFVVRRATAVARVSWASATGGNTLQNTATRHCNTPVSCRRLKRDCRDAPHCNTLQHDIIEFALYVYIGVVCCNVLQSVCCVVMLYCYWRLSQYIITAKQTLCNTLQHTTPTYTRNTLQRTAVAAAKSRRT